MLDMMPGSFQAAFQELAHCIAPRTSLLVCNSSGQRHKHVSKREHTNLQNVILHPCKQWQSTSCVNHQASAQNLEEMLFSAS
nr:hypothetical protein Iba_chr02bCG16800 [Ipomoea batatas]GMC68507.1 hypothetical protein Iba_chr02fCG12560 [Ipomoea batatas]